MKLTAKAGDLLAAVNRVRGAVPSRSPIPILECVRLAMIGQRAALTATNMEMWLSSGADIEAEGDVVWCLPAHRLAGLLDSWQPTAAAHLSDDEIGRIKVECGRSRVLLSTLSATDFPSVAVVSDLASTFQIEGYEIARIARGIAPVIEDGVLRPALAGIHLWPAEGALDVIGAAAARVCRIRCPISGDGITRSAIVSKDAIATAFRTFGEKATIDVAISESLVSMQAGDDRIIARLLNHESFDFDRVIAGKVNAPAVVNSEQLAEVAARCLAATDPIKTGRGGSAILKLAIVPESILASDEFSDFSDAIECLSAAAEVNIALSAKHVVDAAAAFPGGLIEIHASRETTAARVCRPGDDANSVTLVKFRI